MGFFDILYNMDFFQIPVVMNIDDQPRHQTKLGLTLSTIILAVSVYLMYFFSKEVFNQKLPQVVARMNETPYPDFIQINPSNQFIAFSLQTYDDWQNILDEQIYYVELAHQISNLVIQGNVTDNIIYEDLYKIERCSATHFENIKNTKIYDQLIEKDLYCIPSGIFIGGNYDMGQYQSINIRLQKCISQAGQKCQEQSVIDSLLQKVFFTVYTISQTLQPANTKNPLQSIGTSFSAVLSPNTISQEILFQYSKKSVEMDAGMIVTDSKYFTGFSPVKFTESVVDEDAYFLSFIIENGKSVQDVFVTFRQLQSVIPEVFSIVNCIFIVLAIIFQYYFQRDFYLSIIKQFYINEKKTVPSATSQQGSESEQKSYQRRLVKTDLSNFQNCKAEKHESSGILNELSQQNFEEFQIDPQGAQDNQEYQNGLQQHLLTNILNFPEQQHNKIKQQKFDIENVDLDKQIAKLQKQDEGNIIDLALEQPEAYEVMKNQIFTSIDVIEILQAFEEIETLQFLTLDSDQLNFYPYLSKPTLYYQNGQFSLFHNQDAQKKAELLEDEKKEEEEEESVKSKNYQFLSSFTNLKNSAKYGNQISQKIIQSLDPQFFQLFKQASNCKNIIYKIFLYNFLLQALYTNSQQQSEQMHFQGKKNQDDYNNFQISDYNYL